MHRPDTHPIHATCVALPQLKLGRLGFRHIAVLLLGPSGAGKSDLALRLLDRGAQLVADDRVILRRHHADLVASAPPAIADKFEIRGLGIVTQPTKKDAIVHLAVKLVPGIQVERIPDPIPQFDHEGIGVPMIELDPFHASSPAKIDAALIHFASERRLAARPATTMKAVLSWR